MRQGRGGYMVRDRHAEGTAGTGGAHTRGILMTHGNGGNGRDQLGGKIAGQEVFLKTTQLLPILLLLVGGVSGYLVWQTQDRRLADIAVRLQAQETIERERFAALLRVLETHDYNATREPHERLPLLHLPDRPPPGTP